MATLAVIPARGGSKGIPRKNLRLVAGKPLVAWTIEHARAATSVDRVVVTTDDVEIAATARTFGAEVVMRPPDLAGDAASSESALLHALATLAEGEGYRPDILVFLQCTSPLILPEDIDGTVATLIASGADNAFAAVPFHQPIWRLSADGEAVGLNHDKRERKPRQQAEPQFEETGAVYALRAAGFVRDGHRFFGRTVIHVMPRNRHLDIDEEGDLDLADLILRRRAGMP